MVGVAGLVVGLIGAGATLWFGQSDKGPDSPGTSTTGFDERSGRAEEAVSTTIEGDSGSQELGAGEPSSASTADDTTQAAAAPTTQQPSDIGPATSEGSVTTSAPSERTTTTSTSLLATSSTSTTTTAEVPSLEIATSFTSAAVDDVPSNSIVAGLPAFCFDFYIRAPYAGVFSIKSEEVIDSQLGQPVAPPGEQDYDEFITPPSDQAAGSREWKQRICWGVPNPHTSVRLSARAYDTKTGATVDLISLERFVASGTQYPVAPA